MIFRHRIILQKINTATICRLHDLLSEGIHQLSDEECLARSQESEIVLCEIADRMQIALTERKNVKAALASIMNRKAAAGKDASPAEPQV